MSDLEGVVLGGYYLEKRLSKGGIADVYYGHPHMQTDVEVAIKVFHSRHAQQISFREHLRTQVEMISTFEHPNILRVLKYEEGEGLLYIVTPYMQAGTLEDLLLRVGGRFSALQALPIIQQLCDAVQYAHQRHSIHGNIKPTNVLISPQGSMLLADFGVAGDYAEGQQSLTQIGWGAAEYTAPEQSLGVLRPESDIYALGALLFTLLTGVPPFTGQTPVEVLLKHVRQQPPLARELVSTISSAVDDVLQKALRKRADERFASALELRDAFVNAVSIAPVASPLTTGSLFPRPPLPSSVGLSMAATGPHTPIPLAHPSLIEDSLNTRRNPYTPLPSMAAPAPQAMIPVHMSNRPLRHISLKHIDEPTQLAVSSALPSKEGEERKDETMVHNWNFLLEGKNESDEALFWSADPAEWSPIGDIATTKMQQQPLTASDYLQSKPVVAEEDGMEQDENEKKEETTKTLNAVLRRWLPLIIVVLLLLGLLGALCSAFL
ncbi:MAG: protein kinase [Ktedonobacteraceae bacterium]|nr:protein kinase [Ktedonobacteraceae bacterium]